MSKKEEQEVTQEDCNNRRLFKDPKLDNLKDILEELGKLHNTTYTRPKVYNHLKESFQNFCGTAYLTAFYKDQSGGYGSSGYIQALTLAGQKVSEAILKSTPWTSQIQDTHAEHEDCIKKYAEALQACLPKAYAALYYLYFMVSKECKGIGGGTWSGQKVKGDDSSGQDLCNWLIGEDSGSDLPGGFTSQGDLSESMGQKVAQELKNVVSLTLGQYDGSLQKVLCGFMFVCKWEDPLTGHALLFLDKFCDAVEKDPGKSLEESFKKNHSNVSFDTLKGVCEELKKNLNPFVGGSDSGLSAVCHGSTSKLFDTLWDGQNFLQYCGWLKRNLTENISASLQAMFLESFAWDPSTIPHGGNAGPFKYGFVFGNRDWENGKINSKLKPVISKLTDSGPGSLEKLKECLQGSSASSHVSSAGGSSARSSSHVSQTERSPGESSEGTSKASIIGASVGTLGGTAALGGLGYFLRGFLFGV